MLEYISLSDIDKYRDSHYILYVSASHNIAIIKKMAIGIINSRYSHPISCEWCSSPWIYFNRCGHCRTMVQYVCAIHRNMNWCVGCMNSYSNKKNFEKNLNI